MSDVVCGDQLGLLCLLGQEHDLDVAKHSALGDSDSGEQLVQLLVIPDGELQVTGDDPGLLVSGGVSCQTQGPQLQRTP